MLKLKIKILACIGCVLVLTAFSDTDSLFRPTGKAAFVPKRTVEFTEYVRECRENIENLLNTLRPPSENNPYLGGYTNQQVAAMRSPFQIPDTDVARCDDASKGAGKGFLLIHGLTDSPYLMSNLGDSLHNQYPCALIRAVLLPGHGTVPGDSLKMKYQDWEEIVDYGVHGFKQDKKITELYMVGFSLGAALAINYMKNNLAATGKLREDKIKGLVLLATAVKAKTVLAFLTPLVRRVKNWSGKFKERDAARYESFSVNAGAQFYRFTKDMVDPAYGLNVPVLMVESADDETIDIRAAREFFCFPTTVRRRALLWYQSIDPNVNRTINAKDTPELMCDNIVEIKLDSIEPKFNTVNMAHIGLPMSPEDPHYGIAGKYHNCKAYDKNKTTTDQEFNECQGDEKKSIYGESNIKDLKADIKPQYDYLRRGTFNPDYKNLEAKIFCFTNDNCPVSELLETK